MRRHTRFIYACTDTNMYINPQWATRAETRARGLADRPEYSYLAVIISVSARCTSRTGAIIAAHHYYDHTPLRERVKIQSRSPCRTDERVSQLASSSPSIRFNRRDCGARILCPTRTHTYIYCNIIYTKRILLVYT